MPKKLHRGPPTRQSERLATTKPTETTHLAEELPEEPIVVSVERDDNDPHQSQEEIAAHEESASESEQEFVEIPPSPPLAPVRRTPQQSNNIVVPTMDITTLAAAVTSGPFSSIKFFF